MFDPDDDQLERMYEAALGAVLLPVVLVWLAVIVVLGVVTVLWRALLLQCRRKR